MEAPRIWDLYAKIEDLQDRIEILEETQTQIQRMCWDLLNSIQALGVIIQEKKKD